jgi:flavin-dependent dehydrogenase
MTGESSEGLCSVIIVGAGIFGLSTAHNLAQRGTLRVLESRTEINTETNADPELYDIVTLLLVLLLRTVLTGYDVIVFEQHRYDVGYEPRLDSTAASVDHNKILRAS